MFEYLAKFETILVTGPQRAGTRICAQMIAYDTGHDYVDEEDINMDSLYQLCNFMQERRRMVVQCPTLCRYVHLFSGDTIAVVLMRRSVADIIASQKRIKWSWEWLELGRYDRRDGVIAEIKYQFWDTNQRQQIKHAFEVDYESLALHPLWLPQSARQDFRPAQTQMVGEFLTLYPNAYPRPRLGVFYNQIPEHDVAFLIKSLTRGSRAKRLNATAQLIWNLCDGQHTGQDILKTLQQEFTDVEEERLAHDLNQFVNELIAQGFLWLSAQPAG